jgi:hypothetical protein
VQRAAARRAARDHHGLAVARDALDDLPTDDVAPLLMLSVGLALRAA